MKIFSASPTFQANTIRLLVFACIVTLNYATSDKSGEFVADRFNKESIDKPKNNLLLDSNLRNHDTKTYTALPKNDMLVEPKPLSENSNQEFLDYLIMWLSAIIACVSDLVKTLTSLIFEEFHVFIYASLYGVGIFWLSWVLIYFDSKIPGVYPPSPISPKKHRYCSKLNVQYVDP